MNEDYLSTLQSKNNDEEGWTVVGSENNEDNMEEETIETVVGDHFPENRPLTDEEKVRIMREQMGDEYVLDDEPETKKQYTQEEIRNLTDTQNLFQSPLFRLSFAEVIKKVSINWKKCSKVEESLHQIKSLLDEMNIVKVEKPTFPDSNFINLSTVKNLKCNSPKGMAIIGSYLLRTVCQPYKNIDISVTMPEGYITKKDYGRNYFEKRAYYLLAVAQCLKKNEEFTNCTFEPFRGDYLKPILVINFKYTKKSTFKIRIFPTVSEDVFDKTYSKVNEAQNHHRILEDAYLKKHLEILHNEMKDCPVLVETSILLRVWSRIRNIYQANDGLNGFLFSILLIYLLKQRKINKTMSSLQMLKLLMNWIVNNNDITIKGISLTNKPIDPIFKKTYDLVLLDESGGFNILHRVSLNAWKEVKYEAKLTLELIKDDKKPASVELLFLSKHNPYKKFDAILSINTSKIANQKEECFKQTTEEKTVKTLTTALADRTKYIRVFNREEDSFSIGLVLNKKTWFETVIKGPSPTDKEQSEEFKQFWGKKVVMKDYKGSLNYVVELTNSGHSIQIIEDVCSLVLKKHVDKDISCNVMGTSILGVLEMTKEKSDNLKEKLEEARETLQNTILDLDINIEPKDIAVVSPEFYGVSVKSIKFSKDSTNNLVTPINAILEFSGSSKWPNDLEAIEKLKQLIYIRYSEILPLKNQPTKRWIDIWCGDFVFRMIVATGRELTLLKRSGQALNPNVIEMEKALSIFPLHYRYLTIFNNEFHAFSDTVKLAKRWVHTHMLADYLEEQLVELMCMHVFSYGSSYRAPTTSIAGLVRFIDLIANHSWSDSPLCVNLARDHEDFQKNKQQFVHVSQQFEFMEPKPSMFVVASYNMNFIWTKHNPSPIIVNRMVQIAKNTEVELMEVLQSKSKFPDTLTSTDIESYDACIKLKSPQDYVKLLGGNTIGFDPVDYFYRDVKERFGKFGLIFRDYMNDRIFIAWNPQMFTPKPITISQSVCMKPIREGKALKVVPNMPQIIQEIKLMGEGLIQSFDEMNEKSIETNSNSSLKDQNTSQVATSQTKKRKL
ncbi:hypothetical protein ABK040_001142 [Willaertia magna]